MRYNINCKNLLNASEDPCVEVYESCDRDDAGEDKSAPVLVIAGNGENTTSKTQIKILPNIILVFRELCHIICNKS